MLQNQRAGPAQVRLGSNTWVQKRRLQRAFGWCPMKRGPAVMASRPEPVQPVNTPTHTPTHTHKSKIENHKNCSLSATTTVTKLPLFFGVLYAYIYEYIVRMCTNVFLSMPGTILIFLLPYFFSLMDFLFLSLFSISNFLLSMLNS